VDLGAADADVLPAGFAHEFACRTEPVLSWLLERAGDTIVVTILRTFGIDSALSFTVVERPPIGSIRVFDRPGPAHELIHLAESRAAAEVWLEAHRHPLAVLEEVTADEIAADRIEGRVAA